MNINRKHRYLILILMFLLSAGSVFLIPRININEDMTEYLPSDSRMREGLDTLKNNFPQIDMNAYVVKAMFTDVSPEESSGELSEAMTREKLSSELESLDGVSGILAFKEKSPYSLYQLSVKEGANPKAIAAVIAEKYGDRVIVETNANSNMPDNMAFVLIVGTLLIFGILFLMCSSLMEALLFILTIGLAVAMNMGTNAFLPSVSMMTNTIVAVLQLVLSMDYSIILMNRYRQELQIESNIDKAMSNAIRKASGSILSSSFTTIVGLLALVFMKFKIGLDLGVVLAKGVFFSLVSIYTILPALILMFDKAIRKTQKKVFLLPTDNIARFEMRFRIPLAILFVAIFVSSSLLSQRTELSYASIWESKISDEFPPENLFSVLYRTTDEDKVPSLIDSVACDPSVISAISYPSLLLKQHTADEMVGVIKDMLALLPSMPGADDSVMADASQFNSNLLTPETLKILYYACTHPARDEKMSFEDMMTLAKQAKKDGMIPEGLDVESIVKKYSEPQDSPAKTSSSEPASVNSDSVISTSNGSSSSSSSASGSGSGSGSGVAATTTATANGADSGSSSGRSDANKNAANSQEVSEGGVAQAMEYAQNNDLGKQEYNPNKYNFTKENCTTPLTSVELAEFLGFSKGQASTLYSMAGKKGKNATMTAYEFITYMTGTVLKNKFLRKMIRDDQAEGLYDIQNNMEIAMSRKDVAVDSTSTSSVAVAVSDTPSGTVHSSGAVSGSDAVSVAGKESDPAIQLDSAKITDPKNAYLAKSDVPDEDPGEIVDDPLAKLAEMAFSGGKYNIRDFSKALSKAGITEINPAMIDLLYMYYGSIVNYDENTTLSVEQLIDFLSNEVAVDQKYALFIDNETRSSLSGLQSILSDGLGMMRNDNWSMAAIVTSHPLESAETFEFIDKLSDQCSQTFGENFYFVGESVMYNEMKNGFRRELLILTLLTVVSIFLIVAISFKSLIIPLILVMTVMTGVYVNVFFSGVGDRTMLYLAYLIVQSILMGATIDYGILFTNYYLEKRHSGLDRGESLVGAYKGSIHTIMTSGLIIICAPFIMSKLLPDPTISSILSSLTFGALAAITMILFVLPAVLAFFDRFLVKRK